MATHSMCQPGRPGPHGLPEGEVQWIALVVVHLHTGTGALPEVLDRPAHEGAVVVQAIHVEVDAGGGRVGHATVDQVADDLDHPVHVFGGTGTQVGVGHVQAVHLAYERGLVAARHLWFDLVVDVGDVGHRAHLVARPPQVSDQHVERQR